MFKKFKMFKLNYLFYMIRSCLKATGDIEKVKAFVYVHNIKE